MKTAAMVPILLMSITSERIQLSLLNPLKAVLYVLMILLNMKKKGVEKRSAKIANFYVSKGGLPVYFGTVFNLSEADLFAIKFLSLNI